MQYNHQQQTLIKSGKYLNSDIYFNKKVVDSEVDVGLETRWKCSEMNVSDLIEIVSKYELLTLRNKKVTTF